MKERIECTLQEAIFKLEVGDKFIFERFPEFITRENNTDYVWGNTALGVTGRSATLRDITINANENGHIESHKKSPFQKWEESVEHVTLTHYGDSWNVSATECRKEGWGAHHEAVEKLFNANRTRDQHGNIFVSLKKVEFDKLGEL